MPSTLNTPCLGPVIHWFPFFWPRDSDKYSRRPFIWLHCYRAPWAHFLIPRRKELMVVQNVHQVFIAFFQSHIYIWAHISKRKEHWNTLKHVLPQKSSQLPSKSIRNLPLFVNKLYIALSFLGPVRFIPRIGNFFQFSLGLERSYCTNVC